VSGVKGGRGGGERSVQALTTGMKPPGSNCHGVDVCPYGCLPALQAVCSLALPAGTISLPAELNRILNSIKDLDERSDGAAPGCLDISMHMRFVHCPKNSGQLPTKHAKVASLRPHWTASLRPTAYLCRPGGTDSGECGGHAQAAARTVGQHTQ